MANPYEDLLEQEPGPANPYDTLLDNQDVQRRGAVRDAMRDPVSPDARAEAIKLGDRYQVPADLVERNLDVYRQRAAEDEGSMYDRMIERSPKLAEWLSADPQTAAAARDDVEQLQRLEQTVGFGSALLRGVDIAQGIGFSFLEWAGDVADAGSVEAFGKEGRERNTFEAQQYGRRAKFSEIRGGWDLAQWLIETVGEQIPMMAPSIAGATGGAAAGAAIGTAVAPGPGTAVGVTIGAAIGAFVPSFVMGVGETQQTLKEKDPTASAPLEVFLGGSAVAALDSALPGRIGGRLVRTFGRETAEEVAKRALLQPVKPRFIRGVAGAAITGMATEGLTEALQAAVSDVAAARGAGVPVDWRELRTQMLEEGAAGAVMGGGVNVTTEAATIRRRQAQFAAAQQQKEYFDLLAAGVTDSKLVARLPEKAREFLQRATKDGPLETIYAPVDTFEEYWQSKGVSPAAMAAELTGRVDALEEAKASGADLAIPTADYAVKLAATEHHAFFAQELRMRPDVLNLRETKELEAELAAAAPAGDKTQTEISLETVRQRIYEEARAAGESDRVAADQAALWQQRYEARAARLGADPLALYERDPLRIERDDQGLTLTAAPRPPADRPIDIPASRATTGETRTQRDTRRQGHVAALAAALVRDAQQLDPEVDPAQIRAELDFRLSVDEERQASQRESGRGQDLLRAIAERGGLWWERNTGGYRGEIEHLVEGRDIAGVKGGSGRVVHRRGRATWNDVPGVFSEEGQSPDLMVRSLMQDERFSYLGDDLHALLGAVEDAITAAQDTDTFPGSDELGALGIRPGTAWWSDSWRGESEGKIDESEGNILHGPLAQPAPPANANGETAYFIGWQEGFEEIPALPLYNVLGGDLHNSTVSPENLEARGIPYYPQQLPDSVDTGAGDVTFNPDEFEQIAWGDITVWYPKPRVVVDDVVEEQEPPMHAAVEELTEQLRRTLEAVPTARSEEDAGAELLQQETARQRIEALEKVGTPTTSTGEAIADDAYQLRRVPFPSVDDTVIGRLWAARDEESGKLRDVPLDQVVATQETFKTGVARGYAGDLEDQVSNPPPIALRHSGKFYLADGHHRAIAAWASGRAAMPMYVLDVAPGLLLELYTDESGRPLFAPGVSGYVGTDFSQRRLGAGDRELLERHRELQETKDAVSRAYSEKAARAARPDDELYQLNERNTPPGFEVVAPHLEPEEAGKLRRDTAQRLFDIWETLPSDRDFKDAAIAGAAKRGWYERSTEAIQAIFGPVDSVRFTALLAALSPQTSVQTNLLNAVRTWVAWNDEGRPTDKPSIRAILARSVRGAQVGAGAGVLPSWVNNVVRALKTEDPYAIVLSGPKVQSFARNLWGHLNEVTLDTWMANFALLSQHVFDGELQGAGTDPGKSPGYLAYAVKLRRVADTLTQETGEAWTPAHVQETVWSWTKTLYELAEAEGVSAVTILKQGLTDAAIVQTPDFERLFTEDASVREILEAAGYGEVLTAIEVGFARAARSRDAAAQRARAGARRQGVTPGLLRAARRLDELKRQRQEQAEQRRLERVAAARPKLRAARRSARRSSGEFFQISGYAPLRVRDDAVGEFATRTQLVTTSTRTLPVSHITQAEEAAAAAAYLGRGAQERFDAFVTDAEGRVLGIVGSFKGTVDSTSVHSDILLAEALRIDGAAGIWFAHNHPSGVSTLSVDDKAIGRILAERFADTGVESFGVLAIGEDTWQHIDPGGAESGGPLRTAAPAEQVEVPVLEREFVTRGKLGEPIRTEKDSVHRVPLLAGGQFGIVLLNTKNTPIGFMPIDPVDAFPLRRGDRLAALYRGLSVGGAAVAIIHAPEGTRDAALNVAHALNAYRVTVLDIVYHEGSRTLSQAAVGGVQLTDEFYQLEGFHSRIVRAVEQSPQAKASGEQWKATIRNRGVNLQEFRALAIDTLVDGDTYTREDLLARIRQYEVDVQVETLDEQLFTEQEVNDLADRTYEAERDKEIELAEDKADYYAGEPEARYNEAEEKWEAFVDNEDVGTWYDSEEAAFAHAESVVDARRKDELIDLRREVEEGLDYEAHRDEARSTLMERNEGSAARFADFQMPGPDEGSYREVFLTAPKASAGRLTFPALTPDEQAELVQGGYGDLLRTLRTVSPDDARTLLQQEIEDSAHNERYFGYAGPAREQGRRERLLLEKLRQNAIWHGGEREPWDDGHEEYGHITNPIVRIRFNARTSTGGEKTLFLEEVQPPTPDQQERMPELLRTHWRELAFKWALRHAAINGFHRLAWTSGAMQAKRYDLRQLAQKVEYYPGSKQLAAYKATDGGGFTEVYRKYDVEPAQLERYIGKELSARLLATAPARHGELSVVSDSEQAPEWNPAVRSVHHATRPGSGRWLVAEDGVPRYWTDRGLGLRWFESREAAQRALEKIRAYYQVHPVLTLEGEQLVGGEGLVRLYDRDFRDVVNKLVKKSGAKVEQLEVPFGRLEMPLPANRDNTPEAIAEWRRRHPVKDATRPVPGVAITPTLLEQYLGEQALFQDEPPRPPGWQSAETGTPESPDPLRPGPGTKGAYRPRSRTSPRRIRLVAGQADLSTFLHESGHAFLDELMEDAVSVGPEHQVRRDADTVLRWFGYQGTIEQWRALEVDARRDHHERWSRNFEQYLSEGKAPSPELRELFARFRAWLTAIYRSARGLGVEIAPEIRGVMDRMLATDDAIAAAEAEANIAPLFTDPASAGVSPEVFAEYRAQVGEASRLAREAVDARMMQEWRREREAWWQNERELVFAAVRQEVHAQPVYIALSVMRTGKMPDGALPEFGDGRALKLSKRELVAQFGPEILKRLPRPYIYQVEGGLAPQVLAELTGFSSADALIQAVIAAPAPHRIIEAETDRRMRERHGDLLLDGMSLRDVAEAAVHEHRAAVIAAELRALTAGMTRAALPTPEALNAAARERIARTKVRELKPGLYLQAARRASRQAFEAFGSNDRAGAVRAKQQELMSMALYREARDARQRAQAMRDELMRFTKPAARAKLGKAGQEYVDQVDGFLDRYELSKVPQAVLDRRRSLRAWVQSLEQQGLPIDIPDQVLDDSRRVNYLELTVEELEGVRDAVLQIAHLARVKRKLLKSQDQRELNEIAADLAGSLRANAGRRRPPELETRLPSQQAGRTLEGVFAAHRKIASLAREMDGFEDGGAVWEHIIRPVNEAGDREAAMNADATARLAAIFDRHYRPEERARFYRPEYVPALGPETHARTSLSKMGRLMAALNWGNETNRQRLRDGRGWTDQQVQAILDTLDRRDWQFVQDVWDFVDSYWPQIADKQRRVLGVAPAKVEATPVFTRFGEFRGGYFPLKYEGQLAPGPAAHQEAELATLQQHAAYATATTRRGHTKERAEGAVKLPVRLDFGVLFEHTGAVIHDLTHHEMLVDVGRILRHEAVATAIYETHGDIVYQQYKNGLRDVAFGDLPARDHVERVVNHLRTGSTVVGLGWSLTTAMLQPLGLTQSMKRIGIRWVGVGVRRWLGSPERMSATVEWIHGRSTFMQLRAQTMQREINEIRNQVGLDTGRLSGWVDEALRTVSADRVTKQGIADSYFYLITRMQMVADVPTWLGAYERAMADPQNRKDDGTVDEARAVALADQAVLDSQGGGQIKDLASVQRGSAWLKLWTNFYSFFNTTFNLWTESYRRAKVQRTPAAIGRLAVDYLLLFTIPATLGALMRATLKGELDDEDELVGQVVGENLSYMAGLMLGLRELGGALQGYAGYEGPAGARGVASLARFTKQAAQGEVDRAFVRAAADVAGTLFHLPAGQVRRTLEGVVEIMEGRAESPAVLVSGAPR